MFGASYPQSHLEHIAASWSDLAAELKKTDAPGASSHAPHEGASPYDE
jgi:hypothetical protein